MPLNAKSLALLQLVNPDLSSKIQQMAEMLDQENITFIVTQGLRSWQDQDKLYQQGRTTPGKIVTNAAPGHSWHNFGLAVDVAPDDPTLVGFQLDWNVDHPVWKRLISVGESLGLLSGSEFRTFPDWPHFQLTGTLPISPDGETRQTFMDGGMIAVWKDAGLNTGEENA